MAFVFSLQLSSDVRGQLGRIQNEASANRIRAVLQALDQDLQSLSSYTLGYAMWDDTYAYVQHPDPAYPTTNYAESVLAASPVQLVGIYDPTGRLLFSAALDEAGKTMPVPPELALPAFGARFTAFRRLDDHDTFTGIEWLGGRPYLLSAWPVTNSARTAAPKGAILFGTLVGKKILDRIATLTFVTVQPERNPPLLAGTRLTLRTPLLSEAQATLAPSLDGPDFNAVLALGGPPAPAHPVAFQLHLPASLSQTATSLDRAVRLDFLLVSAAFAIFVLFAGWEISRRRREGQRLQAERAHAERLAEEATSADRAKSAFLAVMSHEIRTPLNAIVGYAELLEHIPLDPESTQAVKTIRESSGGLLRVLNDILDFSKLEAGALAIHCEPVSIRALVTEIHSLFELQALTRENRLILDLDPALPPRIVIDGTRLKQVLANLVSNATKFSHQGEIRIAVAVASGPRRLRISVTDDGIGITPEQESRLFQAFNQVDSSPTRRYDGTGLGLAISRRLCLLMGGTLTFQRRQPHGSLFQVEIPFEPAAPEPAAAPAAPPATPPVTVPIDILVVDDNPTNARLLTAILKRLGLEARIALSGAEALARVAERRADLILMDIQMPEMDGFETTRRIRAIESSRQIPPCRIVAVTADILETSYATARAAGMDDYLGKPVKPAQIRAVIEATTPHA
jgi:signal transduction histidine kinase/CheY-like chemotaxis protein